MTITRFGSPVRKPPSALLEIFCPVPTEADAVLSDGAWNRRRHEDLHAMTQAELLQEKIGARLRLALEKLTDPPSDSVRWLTVRIAQVNAKLRCRG